MPVRRAARAAAIAILLGASSAHADDREVCASASELAQTLKLSGKLTDASTQVAICARPVCPKVVRKDCEELATEIEQAQPTIAIDARDAGGHDLTAVRVTIDDVVVAETLTGKAIPVNPGPHAMKYETAGAAPITDNVVVREGQKARVLEVRFASPAKPQPVPPPPPAPEPHSTPTLVYILGGVGVVSLGVFTVLALSGQSRFDDCAESKACSSSTKSGLGTERVIAWTTLGVGVASLAAAGFVFYESKNVAVTAGGVRGTF